MAININ